MGLFATPSIIYTLHKWHSDNNTVIYAECRYYLSVVLNVILLNVDILSVVMLSVEAPIVDDFILIKTLFFDAQLVNSSLQILIFSFSTFFSN